MTAQAAVHDPKAFGELVGFLMKRLQQLEERVEELESEVNDDIMELKGMIKDLVNDVSALDRIIVQNEERIDDLESDVTSIRKDMRDGSDNRGRVPDTIGSTVSRACQARPRKVVER